MAVPLTNIRNQLLPGLMAQRYSLPVGEGLVTELLPEPQPLDPPFSLDELEAAQAIIDSLKK
jgi:hypothetical protein